MITNTVSGKKYIGKTFSYVKHGKRKNLLKYGAEGRFKRHCSNALAGNNEIPLLYESMKENISNFKIETLEICLKSDLKQREKYFIKIHESYKKDKGYNFHVGDNKPEDDTHKKEYEIKKIESNKKRAEGGKLRQSDETLDLPPNIYKRPTGLFAQIKLDSKLYNKAFLSSKDTDICKLEKALEWLRNIKLSHTNQNQPHEIEL